MKQPTPWWMWLLPLPVVWWAALLTAGAWQPGMDLLQLMAGLSTVLQRPWDIRWTQYSGRCLLLFTLAYAVGIGMALSNTTATRRGEEHGSARWGDVFSIARRYRDKRGGNLILTQHFSIGWDGYRHKHNINVLVVGGSGAGKTRGYCVPNILEAAGRDQNAPPCSIVCSDPKSEVLRKTGALLIARGYEVRVLDLTSPAASFCYNPLRYIQYTCSAYSKVPVGTLCQTQHRINADVVMELIKELLKAVAEYSQLNREEFLETVKKAQTSQQSSEITRLKSRLAEAKKRVQELEKLICRIYEDNILGKLPDERYAILDGQYSKEQKDLSAEIADMEAELSGYEEGRRSAEKFIALVDKYQNFEELTTYMLNEFVEKIVVHERDRKGSVETTQEVEIYFNFIGRYLPPHFGEVKMTPEEIEEMEKREARKDRLHQNYLRRKANGKQQEYYERTKAKKKAELDAKKEEIRQEDIAKGVFIPLSLLPPAEPKKGVASA